MDPPTKKAEILERNRLAIAAWEAALAELDDRDLVQAGAVGEWSVKDIVAHIASDDRWFAGQLEAAMRGELPTAASCYGDEAPPPPATDLSTQDGRNAWHHARFRDLPLAEVRQLAAGARARRDAALAALPESEFEALYAIVELGHVAHLRPAAEGEQGRPLWRAIAGNAWHHYEDHTKDVRAFASHLDRSVRSPDRKA